MAHPTPENTTSLPPHNRLILIVLWSVYLKGEMMGKVWRAASRGKSRGLGHVDEEVGARVRQFRLRMGLSQTTLADGLGVTFQQVQKYEKGTNAIATARPPMLCDVLGITPNDLYGDLFTNKRANNPPAPQLDTVTVKAAIMMDRISPRVRSSIFKLIANLAGEGSFDEELQRDKPTHVRHRAKGAALRAPAPAR
jgi:transcriptional regulator with XRE-family HTH domain